MPKTLIPAAEYVRMSTEEQPNSIVLQQESIRQYAATHGYEVVTTYADPGKSGIEIKHRPGLRQLIHDATDRNKRFKAVLVYDVSRWGRFQDIDESAYYEFLCRSAGATVHYCAEQFENDGMLPNDIMKSLKRTMAAEYSRQLSVKARAGMAWLALRGFHLGSRPGYGLQRLLVSHDGRRKHVLKPNERKYLNSDRVVLAPGPQREVNVIRTVFALAEKRQNSPARIAQQLNRRAIKYRDGKPWNKVAVLQILKNEKYTGCSVWGKTQKPFNRFTRKLPRADWIKKEGAFAPVICAEQFNRVQRVIRDRNRRLVRPNEYFLNAMKRVLAKDGKLTLRGIKKRVHFHNSVYVKRFGSLMRAYELVGFRPSARSTRSVERMAMMIRLRREVLAQLKHTFPSLQIVKCPGNNQREILEFDEDLRISLQVCRPLLPYINGQPKWCVRVRTKEGQMPSLICLPDLGLTECKAFYLLPEFGTLFAKYKNLREGDDWFASGERLGSLGQLRDVACKLLKQPNHRHETRVGDVVFEQRTSAVRIGQKRITLSRGQAALFKLLVGSAGCVVTNAELCRIFHEKHESMRSKVADLRKTLGCRLKKRIVTVKGVGMMYCR